MRTLGLDIGTGSSKAVLVDEHGLILATAVRQHATSSPHPGWFEHDPDEVWWREARELIDELLTVSPGRVDAACFSGIGPAVAPADADDEPLRPAILYGIDTRATEQIEHMSATLGRDRVLQATGNLITTQAIGPKIAWIADHEPAVRARTVRIYSAPGWIVRRLTGEYTLDHHSASVSVPLYDLTAQTWWEPAWADLVDVARPRLAWPSNVVGTVSSQAARATGLPEGTPVLAGTIDAVAEAHSVGVTSVGDMMLMFGSTMFFIQVVDAPVIDQRLWAGRGVTPGSSVVAAGMSTSGLLISWVCDLVGADPEVLTQEAAAVGAGCDGLLLLPYLAGERTPLFDPSARGAWIGLTLRHERGHLFRSALEAIAFGIRHNIDTMAAAGAAPRRLVAVGGGAQNRVWLQIVADVIGLPIEVPTVLVGASYGDARMAAEALGADTSAWNPIVECITPSADDRATYEAHYRLYLEAYPALRDTMHRLAQH